jgi:hypothetical protein
MFRVYGQKSRVHFNVYHYDLCLLSGMHKT